MVEIRNETESDLAEIDAVTVAAFRNAPHTSRTEQWIVRALRARNELTLSLIAQREGRLLGHVAVSPVTLSDGSPDWYGLGPISVQPVHQRQGIGSQLMATVLTRLRELGAAGCVLLGDPVYYQRFGFQAEPELQLPGVPPQYFLAVTFRLPVPSATVTYSPAFNPSV